MAELYLEIVTPAKAAYKGEVKSVTIPGTMGSFQVLKNHAPLIATFEIGVVKVKEISGNDLFFATGGGTVEVNENKVLVIADSLENAEEIEVERAESAKRRAEERISKREPETDLERAKAALLRATNRLKIVEKYVRGLA